jgi:hypothetical protein
MAVIIDLASQKLDKRGALVIGKVERHNYVIASWSRHVMSLGGRRFTLRDNPP